MVPTLAPAGSTLLPATRPEAGGKVMVNWCCAGPDTRGAATATPIPATQRAATPVPTESDLFMPSFGDLLRLAVASVHPQRAFGGRVEELLDELVGGVLHLLLGPEVPHLPLVEHAHVARQPPDTPHRLRHDARG